MGEMPRPSGKDMVRFLQGQRFVVVRVRGSHHFLEQGEHRTSIPVHGNNVLK